jgi:excisionase family DNA binding protein
MATEQDIEAALEKVLEYLRQHFESSLDLLTFKDAAEIMKVDVKTARRFLSKINKVRIGKQYRIKKTDFIEYIKKHEE